MTRDNIAIERALKMHDLALSVIVKRGAKARWPHDRS